MNLAKNILSNTFVQFFGRIVTAFLAIISVKLITLYLGVEGYGAYTTVYEFVGLFAIIGDLGLYTIAVREMAEKEDEQQKIYSNVLTMRAVMTAFVMLLVGIGGMFIPAYQDSLIPFGIWICTLGVWLNLFNSIITSILQYKLKMHLATVSLIIGKVLSVAVVVAAVLFMDDKDLGFYLMVAAGIVGHGVMMLLSLVFASRYAKVVFAYDWDYWKHLIKKAWPYGLALILSTIYFKVDVTLLSVLRGQEEVGYYGVPLRMIEVIGVLPLFFMNSVLGTMTQAIKESKERVQKIFSLSFQFLLTAALPVVVFTYFFRSDLIRIISSDDFLSTANSFGSDSVLMILVFAMVVYFFSTLFSFTLVAFHKQNKVLWINASGATVNLIANLYFIPIYGFMGAAATSLVSEFIVLIVAFFMLQKVFAFQYDVKLIFKTIFAGIISFVALWFLIPLMDFHWLAVFFVSGVCMTLIYGAVLYCTRAIDIAMLKKLAN